MIFSVKLRLVATLLVVGCGNPPPGGGDGGAGSYTLASDGAPALGLGYAEVQPIAVRYLDDHMRPIPQGTVRFRIFGDPAGSTLSADRATTDEDGRASVNLTAGVAEASFRVVASADAAPDLTFSVAVSKFAFVEIDAQVGYTGAGMGSVATLRALLYDDHACAQLAPSPSPPEPLRSAAVSGSASATLPFPLLLAVDYAVVGRADDANGHPIAWGCVDVSGAQLAAGARVAVPVALARVSPSVIGAWQVHATVPIATQPPADAPWRALAACPRAPAQPLLDALQVTVGAGPIADGIAARRGVLDGNGCRPEGAPTGGDSLDASLQALLTGNGAPALALGAVAADVTAIEAQATVDSRLTLRLLGPEAPGPLALDASHAIGKVGFAGAQGAHPASYDLDALGFPVVTADGVPATLDGDQLTVGEHGFTVRLPVLWGRAVADVALAPRNLPTTPRALLAAVVGAATRMVNGQPATGCAAVEDLVCKAIGAQPCVVAPACEAALDRMAQDLAAAFAAPAGIDCTLSGGATAKDADGDLVADALAGGFDAKLTMAAGKPVTAKATWAAAPTK